MLNKSKYSLEHFIKFFVLLADASLIIRIGIIKPYTLQPFEFFILVATVLFIILWYKEGISDRAYKYLKFYGKIFLITIILFLIGTILGYIKYGMNAEIALNLIKDLFYLSTIFLGLIFHIYYGNEKTFRKKALLLMSLPVLFSIFLVMPKIAEKISILGNGNSFIGLQENITVVGFYLLIPFSLFTFSTLKEIRKLRKYVYWILAILSFSLILWTGSRAAWLAVLGILFVYLYMYTKHIVPLTSRILRIFIIGCCLIASASLSFLLLPHSVKVMSLDRVFPHLTNFNPSPVILVQTKITFPALTKPTIIPKETASNTKIVDSKWPAYQSRQSLWPQAFSLLMYHPFGLGPEYGSMSKKILDPAGKWTRSHNTFLQAGLSGGFMFLILIIICIYWIFKKLYIIPNSNERNLLFGLWVGFLIILSLGDYLFTIPWVWIIAGLILGKSEQINNQENSLTNQENSQFSSSEQI